MSKLLKSILIASLVICATVCIGLFATACDGNNDNEVYINVTVVLPDSNHTPVKDAEVDICTNEEPYFCLNLLTKTDENGLAKLDITSITSEYKNLSKFFIKVHGVPTGYVYADGNGVVYSSDDGKPIDTNVDGHDITITLTEATAVNVDTITPLSPDYGYKFTAPKAGNYYFTVSNSDENWTLGSNEIRNNYANVPLAANEVIGFSVQENCKILISDLSTTNYMENPDSITVGGKAESFSAMLVKGYDKATYTTKTVWGIPEGAYCFEFTNATAGNIKVTLTGDAASVSLIRLDVSTDDLKPNSSLVFSGVAAGDYRLQLSAKGDYEEKNLGDVISGTVKIEYVEDGDIGGGEGGYNEETGLQLGATNIDQAGLYDFFEFEANKCYIISISGLDGTWKVNNANVAGTSTEVTPDDSTFNIAIEVSGACTITITEKTN